MKTAAPNHAGATGLFCLESGPPDRLKVVCSIEFRSVRAPRTLFDGQVDVPELIRGDAKGYHLSYAHHYVPGNNFGSFRWEFPPKAGAVKMLVDFIQRLALIVPEEYGQQKRILRVTRLGSGTANVQKIDQAKSTDEEASHHKNFLFHHSLLFKVN
jgi:hypothetical protein